MIITNPATAGEFWLLLLVVAPRETVRGNAQDEPLEPRRNDAETADGAAGGVIRGRGAAATAAAEAASVCRVSCSTLSADAFEVEAISIWS